MSDAVAVALIYALSAVLVASVPVFTVVVTKLLGRLKAIQHQVANDHRKPDGSPLNLRDDLDHKHEQNNEIAMKTYRVLVKVQSDISWLMRQSAEHDDRLDDLEDTMPTKGKQA